MSIFKAAEKLDGVLDTWKEREQTISPQEVLAQNYLNEREMRTQPPRANIVAVHSAKRDKATSYTSIVHICERSMSAWIKRVFSNALFVVILEFYQPVETKRISRSLMEIESIV